MSSDDRSCAPNYMIIGAPKAGTTSLFATLCKHPDVFPSRFKETHFFNSSDLYGKGIEHYINTFFAGSSSYSARGEATPAYLRKADVVIPRLKAAGLFDQMKFIVVLRDPVERSWSHFLHRKRSLNEDLSFEAALAAEEGRLLSGEDFSGYFECSLYGKQLTQWMSLGRREQFLVVLYEDFVGDAKGTFLKITDFLGISPIQLQMNARRQNQAGTPRFHLLMNFLRDGNSPIKRLFKTVLSDAKRREIKTRIRQWNVKSYTNETKPVLDVEQSRSLRSRFTDDIEKLESLLGLDLSGWKKS